MVSQKAVEKSDSLLIAGYAPNPYQQGGGDAVKQQNQGLVLPVGETIRLDYIGAETVVTHLVSHEQGKLPGHWTLETTDDGEVGTLMCQDVNGQFDMQDVFEVLKNKVAVKVATG